MKPRKEFQALLTRKKLKKTSQREFIWQFLMDSKGHPSVEEIRDHLLVAINGDYERVAGCHRLHAAATTSISASVNSG